MNAAANPGAPAAAARAPASFLLPRPRLSDRLDEAFGRRLAVVVAGAGYGKTTLLAAWTDDLESTWYTATAKDQALPSFAAGVAEAVLPRIERLPDDFLGALASGQDESTRAELLAGALGDAFAEALAHDVVFVLDDAQEVARSPSALRFVEALCRQSPPTLHVVLASRVQLELRLDRFRAQGQVVELTADDLAFTLEEVEALTAAALEDGGRIGAEIHAATRGWPAAVRLALEALRNASADERRSALERLRRRGSPLFSFLAREVFERESPEVGRLVRTVAPLDRFTVGLCEALGVPDAGEQLEGLVERGLFVHQHEDWLSLHDLVREFVLAVWPLDGHEQRRVHERAAAWLESDARISDALREYAAASDPTGVSRVLATHGESLLAAGQAEALIAFAGALPADRRSREVDRLLADAFIARGELDRAIECLDRWLPTSGVLEPDLVWRVIVAHYLHGEFDRAIEVFLHVRVDGSSTSDEALVFAWGAAAHVRRGDVVRGGALAQHALEVARACGDPRALAAAHNTAVLAGQLEAPDDSREAHFREALAAAERGRDLFHVTRTRINWGYAKSRSGRYRAALDDLDVAVPLAEATAAGHLVHALQNRGGVQLLLGELDAARADCEAAVEVARETGAYGAYAWRGLAAVFRERGDVALARAACEHARAAAEEVSDPTALEDILMILATLLVDEDPDEAARLVDRAGEYRWLQQARAMTAAGWIALARGAPAGVIAKRALELAREGRDPDAVAEALSLSAFADGEPTMRSGLEEALAIWRELGNPVRATIAELAVARRSSGIEALATAERAERRLGSLGVRVSAAGPAGLLRMVARPAPAAVAVQTLGGFRVLRHGAPVARSEWPSRKARDLLKILVARRGRATPRDLLMEELWPREERSKLGNRLSVALSTLRSLLDPDRQLDSERFVRSDRDSVALDLDEVAVDVELFLHEAEAGLALRERGSDDAFERLEQAEALYAGDFLDEDPYEEWAIPLREECRATYIEVAHALAADRAAADDDASARYLLRIIARDAYDERAHLRLVETLERLGRRGEARRAYRRYVGRMEELGVAPAAFPA